MFRLIIWDYIPEFSQKRVKPSKVWISEISYYQKVQMTENRILDSDDKNNKQTKLWQKQETNQSYEKTTNKQRLHMTKMTKKFKQMIN